MADRLKDLVKMVYDMHGKVGNFSRDLGNIKSNGKSRKKIRDEEFLQGAYQLTGQNKAWKKKKLVNLKTGQLKVAREQTETQRGKKKWRKNNIESNSSETISKDPIYMN